MAEKSDVRLPLISDERYDAKSDSGELMTGRVVTVGCSVTVGRSDAIWDSTEVSSG